MKRLTSILITATVLLLSFGCGGGGGGSGVTPPSSSLVGTYDLCGFIMDYPDLGFTEDETDYEPWSGEMIIGPNSFTQSYIISGAPVSGSNGTYNLTFTFGNTEGYLSGTNFTTMYFAIDGMDFITLQTFWNATYGTINEYDCWTKVSDSYQ